MPFFVEEPVRIFIEEPRKIKKVKMNKEFNKCKIDKDISEFYKRSGRGTGLAGYTHICKSCTRKTNRKYNKNDGDFDEKEYQKKYREKNKEILNEYIKKWREDKVCDIQL